MGVYIKGLQIESCEDGFDGRGLVIIGYDDKLYAVAHKSIIPLPDHGDLVDRDKFVAEKREQFCADCRKRKSTKTGDFVYEIGDCVCRACDTDDMLDYIEEAPVVIPAERSEE